MTNRFDAEEILRAAASGAIPGEGEFLIRGTDGWEFGLPSAVDLGEITFDDIEGILDDRDKLPAEIAYEDEVNTFSKLNTFSAGIVIADGFLVAWSDVSLSRGAAGRIDLSSGDAFRVDATGALEFGTDISLARGAADRLDLAVGDSFRIDATGSLQFGADVSVSRGAVDRLDLATGDSLRIVSGQLQFGADVNLFRDAADLLKTDDSFEVGANLIGGGTGTFVGALLPSVDDGAALGVSGTGWADLFLATGGVINFGAGNMTFTHSVGDILLTGGTLSIDGANALIFGGDASLSRGAVNRLDLTSGDSFRIIAGQLQFGADVNLFRDSTDILKTDDSFSVGVNLLVGGDALPSVDDGARLGISGQAWSDLFLASGAVINFDAGDITLTHSLNDLLFAGGSFSIDAANLLIFGGDASLFRGAANRLDLTSGDDFRIVAGDLQFGVDVNLFRDSANVLKTDDDFVIGGNLLAIGTGPHGIGVTAVGFASLIVLGAFTSDGSNILAAGTLFAQDITGAPGDLDLGLTVYAGSVTTQTATEDIPRIATLVVNEPDIDATGLTGNILNAATIIATGAPTEGLVNSALLVQAGDINLSSGSDIIFGADANFFRDAANVLKTDDSLIVGVDLEIDGDLNHDGSNVGFFGTAPAAKPTVTGSRAGNAALADLLTDLATLGLITDSSSA